MSKTLQHPFAVIRNRFEGEQCVIVATGPSVMRVPLTPLEKHPHLIGVNAAYRLFDMFRFWCASGPNFYVPNAPAICHCEAEYFVLTSDILKHKPLLPPEKHTLIVETFRQRLDHPVPLSWDFESLIPNGLTVALDVAFPLAIWAGYKSILLVGTDYSLKDYSYFYTGADHEPKRLTPPTPERRLVEMQAAHLRWEQWHHYLATHLPLVEVINCSPLSDLTMWPRKSLEEALWR